MKKARDWVTWILWAHGTVGQCLQGLEVTPIGENVVRNEIGKYYVGLLSEFM